MKVVFRVDASPTIGTGHVMRCLTLATALQARGAEIVFICRNILGYLQKLIESQGHVVVILPLDAMRIHDLQDSKLAHAEWLGSSWQTDAEQTCEVLKLSAKADWLIVDHYALDARWERRVRSNFKNILVIDDLADRPHECEVLLDQNLVAGIQHRYEGKLPDHCKQLLGPEYALLDPIYQECRKQVRIREGAIRRIFVFFGGADQANLTGLVLAAFLDLKYTDVEMDIVVAQEHPHLNTIARLATEYAAIHLHRPQPSLAPLMMKADIAIGAAGGTSWERLCLGLPALIVSLADNQRPIAKELHRLGLVRWLGHVDEVNVETFKIQISQQLASGLDGSWSRKCREIVDGKGVERVCALLSITAGMTLKARIANAGDERLLLQWANDPKTRQFALNQAQINAETHHEWLAHRLQNPHTCRIYILETLDDFPVGQVRFDLDGGLWMIDYSIDPIFRGRGLGSKLLSTAIDVLRLQVPNASIAGRVKVENFPSRKVFEKLGFTKKAEDSRMIAYQLSQSD